ncbi:MAG TPA: hypothetical protein VLL52_09060 [Anaerolineae bacterium]|nr:hypothetical protein [Anaerolineae bacterium]
MSDEELIAKLEEIIGEADLVSADEWGQFSVNVFKAVEKAASFAGQWAEFDAAMRVLHEQLGTRIETGRWPE